MLKEDQSSRSYSGNRTDNCTVYDSNSEEQERTTAGVAHRQTVRTPSQRKGWNVLRIPIREDINGEITSTKDEEEEDGDRVDIGTQVSVEEAKRSTVYKRKAAGLNLSLSKRKVAKKDSGEVTDTPILEELDSTPQSYNGMKLNLGKHNNT